MRHPIMSAIFAAAAFLTPVAASAADLKPVYKAPPAPVATFNWTGFYVGGSVGARWMEGDWNTTCLQTGLAGTTCPNTAGFPGRITTDNPASFDATSFRGGVYAGFNWQVNTWVFGIEGDWAWAKNDDTRAGIPGT